MAYTDKLHAKFAILNDVVVAKAELSFPSAQATHIAHGYVQSFMIGLIASSMSQKDTLLTIDNRIRVLRTDIENNIKF